MRTFCVQCQCCNSNNGKLTMTKASYSDQFSNVHDLFVASVFEDLPTYRVSQNIIVSWPDTDVFFGTSRQKISL
jgi:hypothetical protein